MEFFGLCIIALAVFFGLSRIAEALKHGQELTKRDPEESTFSPLWNGNPEPGPLPPMRKFGKAQIIKKQEPVDEFLKEHGKN